MNGFELMIVLACFMAIGWFARGGWERTRRPTPPEPDMKLTAQATRDQAILQVDSLPRAFPVGSHVRIIRPDELTQVRRFTYGGLWGKIDGEHMSEGWKPIRRPGLLRWEDEEGGGK